jgi:hypothetical protein
MKNEPLAQVTGLTDSVNERRHFIARIRDFGGINPSHLFIQTN